MSENSFDFYCGYCGHKSIETKDIAPQCSGETSSYGRHHIMFMTPQNREDKRKKLKHPIQPLEDDGNGVLRFKQNAIVRYLVDSGIGLNALAVMNFYKEDWEQLAQLIGYSLSGFGDLSYVSDKTYEAAFSSAKNALKQMSKRSKLRQKGK